MAGAKNNTVKDAEDQNSQGTSAEQASLDLEGQTGKKEDKASDKPASEPVTSNTNTQYFATLVRGKTFDVGGIVFKVDEEKEVTESLYARLANNALFSVRKE
ncbi:hypothetical protein QVE09_09485 [Paenibacillus sp. ClWae2A]|uniref:hypothetical protein n=1 Tax=Paenibacillus sp. ClWae2A TaxID=3057177 RepID=UPI0028F60469|nr:hypothetical protein [Paenibacillus sp. ClWae2A]MDT9719133.1 hypothetical protein [Paenibacillus sp. ClWae2A]